MNTTKSTHSQCAKAIRELLKAEFPSVNFSVRSMSYAGGDAVDVFWDNGPTWSREISHK